MSAKPPLLRPSVAPALMLLALTSLLAGASGSAPARVPPGGATHITYEGTLFFEAHYRHPGDVHPYHSRQEYSTNARGDARLDWTTWEDGDTLLVPETFLFAGGRLFHRDAPDQPWRQEGGERARLGRLQAFAGLPNALAMRARAEADPRADLTASAGRLLRYTRLQAHPRLGDVRDSVAFSYAGADPLPDSMSMALYTRDSNWRLGAHRVASSLGPVADSLFAAPMEFQFPRPDELTDSLAAVPPLIERATGIWSAELSDIDSRTLIVDFADHLAVIEAAVGSANGERIVDAARRQWPGKPIRYALFSHYHPHYTGGLRAFIAEGATVVTTPGNAAFVRHVAELPFTTRPDRLARHPQPVHVVAFTDRTELADSTNRLVCFDYGARSQHTDEFVVFWFPRQKLLFESELGWVPTASGPRASRRLKPLLAWVDEQTLDVGEVVQGWPMRDTPATLARGQLDSLLAPKR